jgi:hypothetical protein
MTEAHGSLSFTGRAIATTRELFQTEYTRKDGYSKSWIEKTTRELAAALKPKAWRTSKNRRELAVALKPKAWRGKNENGLVAAHSSKAPPSAAGRRLI